MGQFSIFTLQQAEEWKTCLQGFPQADIYYYPEYVTSFYRNGDGTPWCIFYEDADTGLRALNVVMVRSVPNPNGVAELEQYIDLVTPYGYGGFLINGNDTQAVQVLQQEYEAFCRENRIVAEFVRFSPMLANAHRAEALYEVIDLGHTVWIDMTSPEIIWQNITSKNRNMIRKAEKNGVEIRQGNSEELYLAFEQIYNATMDKVGASDYYYFKKEFYDSIREDMKEHATCFYAVREEQIIAMSLILYSGTAMHYHLSASVREYQTYAPTNLLLYRAACWGAEHGMRTFHLGGGLGSHEDHLYHFKKGFNRGEDKQFSIGRKIFLPKIYDRICEEVKADPTTSFFPRYRSV